MSDGEYHGGGADGVEDDSGGGCENDGKVAFATEKCEKCLLFTLPHLHSKWPNLLMHSPPLQGLSRHYKYKYNPYNNVM